jgi:hypothetical protein
VVVQEKTRLIFAEISDPQEILQQTLLKVEEINELISNLSYTSLNKGDIGFLVETINNIKSLLETGNPDKENISREINIFKDVIEHMYDNITEVPDESEGINQMYLISDIYLNFLDNFIPWINYFFSKNQVNIPEEKKKPVSTIEDIQEQEIPSNKEKYLKEDLEKLEHYIYETIQIKFIKYVIPNISDKIYSKIIETKNFGMPIVNSEELKNECINIAGTELSKITPHDLEFYDTTYKHFGEDIINNIIKKVIESIAQKIGIDYYNQYSSAINRFKVT